MPRPKTPLPLQLTCLKEIVTTVVSACEIHPNGHLDIQRYSQQLPTILANQYVQILLATVKLVGLYDLDVTGVITNTRCSHLQLDTTNYLSHQILSNLDQMTGLTHLEISGVVDDSWTMACMVSNQLRHIPKLESLRLIAAVSDDSQLIQNIASFSHLLQELCFVWDMSTDQPVTLKDCQNLKRVSVMYYGDSSDMVVYILESIPQLERLFVDTEMESPVLAKCLWTYGLKYFPGHASHELGLLAKHFPHLEELHVKKCDNPSAAGGLVCVKSLRISESIYHNVSELISMFTHTLVSLTLHDIIGVQESFDNLTLRNIVDLTIMKCTCVDIAQIGCIFPRLKSLILISNLITPMTTSNRPNNSFTQLTDLTIKDTNSDFVKSAHLQHIMSSCINLHDLVIVCNTMDNTLMHNILSINPMTQMEYLDIESNTITPDVIFTIFEYFGDLLERVLFRGTQMSMNQDYIESLKTKIRPYHIQMHIDRIQFGLEEHCVDED